jgi:Lipocalin-like domain
MRAPLVGTWRLITFRGRNAEGDVRPALGENPRGLLVYTADGYMIAILSEGGRRPFNSRDFSGGTPEEALAAVNSYISYSGRYEVDGDTVTHHVEMSLFPNWVGQDQTRRLRITEDKLVLSTPTYSVSGNEWTFELVWERVS